MCNAKDVHSIARGSLNIEQNLGRMEGAYGDLGCFNLICIMEDHRRNHQDVRDSPEDQQSTGTMISPVMVGHGSCVPFPKTKERCAAFKARPELVKRMH